MLYSDPRLGSTQASLHASLFTNICPVCGSLSLLRYICRHLARLQRLLSCSERRFVPQDSQPGETGRNGLGRPREDESKRLFKCFDAQLKLPRATLAAPARPGRSRAYQAAGIVPARGRPEMKTLRWFDGPADAISGSRANRQTRRVPRTVPFSQGISARPVTETRRATPESAAAARLKVAASEASEHHFGLELSVRLAVCNRVWTAASSASSRVSFGSDFFHGGAHPLRKEGASTLSC